MPTPRVSVIMPVFNKAPYLEQALDSVLAQTFEGGIELICVDNGSTDGSLDILRRYEARLGEGTDGPVAVAPGAADATPGPVTAFRLLEQDHTGPGVARNAGLDVATGDYVCFLDSDDFLESVALERAVAHAEKLKLDIVVWDTWLFNDRLHRDQHPPVGTLTFDAYVPWDERETRAFSVAENPDAAFTSFQNWPWNKLFRRAFLEEFHLRFPSLHRTEDLPFTCMALVRARRMGVIYERFSHYRIHTGASAMDTKDQHAFDFFEALLLLRRELEDAGLFEPYRRSYARWALSGLVNNLNPLTDPAVFSKVFERMATGGIAELGLTDEALEGYGNEFELKALSELRPGNEVPYLLWLSGALEGILGHIRAHVDVLEADGDAARRRAEDAERERDDVRHELDATRHELDGLRAQYEATLHSAEYRSGRALCKLPRIVQRKVRGK